MKIGVISDTHGLLRPEVIENLQGCQQILHAGDINKREILNELTRIAPVRVVRGNNDTDWAADIPYKLEFELSGVRVLMCHKKSDLPKHPENVDLVVFGHSHKYEDRKDGPIRWLNPGSCGPRRFHQDITMALLEVEGGVIKDVQRIDIPHTI